MLNLSNISIQYGGRFLFDDISFSVTPKDRIGLVGKNGAGKSTMFKVVTGEIVPESGNVNLDGGETIGYLPQTLSVNPTQTVVEEAKLAFGQVMELQGKIDELTLQISNATDYESEGYIKSLQQLSDAQERLRHLGGFNMREEIEKVLKGLGFVNGDFDRQLSEFSGGWQMRVELAKILLKKPSYILLDEPTNHLDIESIMWLEEFLYNYPGGVMLVSHDKAFLDRVGNRTLELVAGKLYDYRTSYSNFVELREKRREKQLSERKKQDKFIEHTEQLINKFRAKKNKAKFAQTLMTKLDRLDRIEVEELETDSIKFRFPPAPRSGKVVVNIRHLSKSYGETHVLDDITFALERGEKIAFVGKNGEGKTTLAKIITGSEPYEGTCEIGHNVSIGYYEQHQAEQLDGNDTVFQVIDDAATGDMRTRVRGLLGAFLFSGEDVDKKVQVLSGGEKSRLALAKMLLDPVNLLVLDEPTNHLDMQAKNILKSALNNFEGSLIVVSHDREFLKSLTDKVYEFKNKKIHEYIGDVYGFLEQRSIGTLDELNLYGNNAKPASPAASPDDDKEKRKERHATLRKLENEIKSTSNSLKKCERLIEKLEKQIAAHEATMNDPAFYSSHPEPDKLMYAHANDKRQLGAEMEKWEELTLALEEMQGQRDALRG